MNTSNAHAVRVVKRLAEAIEAADLEREERKGLGDDRVLRRGLALVTLKSIKNVKKHLRKE